MAPSASLEISWEETKRGTCLESLTPDRAWLVAHSHIQSTITAEFCTVDERRTTETSSPYDRSSDLLSSPRLYIDFSDSLHCKTHLSCFIFSSLHLPGSVYIVPIIRLLSESRWLTSLCWSTVLAGIRAANVGGRAEENETESRKRHNVISTQIKGTGPTRCVKCWASTKKPFFLRARDSKIYFFFAFGTGFYCKCLYYWRSIFIFNTLF